MPAIKPTSRVVSGLSPISGKRTRFTFDGIAGLQLDCTPNGTPHGNRVWRVRYYVGDRQTIATLGTFNAGDDTYLSQSQATEKAAEMRRTAKVEKKDPARVGLTFDKLFGRWLAKHAKVNKRTWQDDAAMYQRHVKQELGSDLVDALKRRDVIDAVDAIAKRSSPIQADRAKTLVSSVFSWALSEDIVEANPATGILQRAPKASLVRDRVLSDAELRAFWRALSAEPKHVVLKLLLLTGLRLSEVTNMRHSELQGDVWEIPALRTKSGQAHSVPLGSLTRSLIPKQTTSDFVFAARSDDLAAISRGTPDHAFHLLAIGLGMVDSAGKPDCGVHDLRRTCATNLAKLGVGQDLIDRIQGRVHKGGVGWIYNRHAYLPEKRAALALWEAELLRIVG